jgi:hypothetical protein
MLTTINKFFHCLCSRLQKGHLRRSLNTLPAMMIGIIMGKDTQMPAIALNVSEPITLPSTEKCFKRLIINEKVDDLPTN